MNKFQEIKNKIDAMEADAEKFYTNKNKAAGTRLRAGFQIIKTLAQEGRTEVLEIKAAGAPEPELEDEGEFG